MKRVQIVVFLLLAAVPCLGQTLTVKEIMAQPSIAGMRVQGTRLSPDGKNVVFLWNAKGENPRDLYLAGTSGGTPSRLLSPRDLPKRPSRARKTDKLDYGVIVNDEFVKSRRDQIGNLRWSPDSKSVLFTQNGDIFVLPLSSKKPKRITRTETAEFSARFLDGDRILFMQRGNLFTINTSSGALTQISKEANQQRRISLFRATPSDDGNMVAYAASDGSKQRALFVPNFLPYYVTTRRVRRGWTTQKVYAAKTDGSQDKAIEAKLPKPEGESYMAGMKWLADGKTLVIDRVDKTHKRRRIYAVRFADKKSEAFLIHEESDDKWIGGPARILAADPADKNRFLFGSQKDGWYHLYLAVLDAAKFADGNANSRIKQLTNGKMQVYWADWTSDSNILALTSRSTPATRVFSLLTPDGAEVSDRVASDLFGMKNGAQMKADAVIFQRSQWNQPGELFSVANVLDQSTASRPVKVTSTTPEGFKARVWKSPWWSSAEARDGKSIPLKIYVPEGFKNADKRPMVIFVHGAGYLQNVINGWNNYYREFMFNQLLVQKGYVVLDIDYRGSAGYGRDWRTDVYDFLGGLDYTDHLDAIDFMVKRFGIDQNRIGVYGGSYGGFMAAMLVMRAPEKIAAAAALRPVMDWKNYYAANPFYTSQRLRSPKENPEGYRRSSPISYAEKLRKPLLILHGAVDSNVHAQDSIQLVEKLIRLDKTQFFELMLYPSENHGFQRPTSWEDEYERILALFERELKKRTAAAIAPK